MNKFCYYAIFISFAFVSAFSSIIPLWISDENMIIEDMQFMFLIYASIYCFLSAKISKNKNLFQAVGLLFLIMSLREVSFLKGFFDNGNIEIFGIRYIKIAHFMVAILILFMVILFLKSRSYKLIKTKPILIDDFLVLFSAFILQSCSEAWHMYLHKSGQTLEEYAELVFYIFAFRIFKIYSQRLK